MILDYKKAKENLLTNRTLECQHFFAQKGYPLELGYCKLLSEDLESAKKIFFSIKDSDIRASWALFMISMIEDNITEYPTYFGLRNFLEIDLNILITYYKGNYIENIIRYADFLFTINPEVHKFIGRVLYINDYKEQAMYFIDRAKNYFFNDPELHYLLGYIYFKDNEYEKAKKALSDCLHILPQYFPAKNLLDKIEKISSKML
jgi:tetratricopeptide (TPR) repeat protein